MKIKIFTEDLEGEWLLKKIINKDFEEYIDIVPLGLGFDEIAKVAYKLSEIKEGIVIYDADVKKRYAQSGNSSDFKRNMDKNKNYLFFGLMTNLCLIRNYFSKDYFVETH